MCMLLYLLSLALTAMHSEVHNNIGSLVADHPNSIVRSLALYSTPLTMRGKWALKRLLPKTYTLLSSWPRPILATLKNMIVRQKCVVLLV